MADSDLGDNVSIHAPAKGATIDRRHPAHGIMVSVHAPAKGATGVGQRPKRSSFWNSKHDTRSLALNPGFG